MSTRTPQNVLARFSPGRTDDIEKIYLHAVSGSEPFVLGVEGPPGAGTSEVLRAMYDRLFLDQRFVVPFYFSFRDPDGDARSAATRYIYEFLLQAIAFRRSEPGLIATSPDICEMKDLAPLQDADWVAKLCEDCDEPSPLNDDRAFIRSAIAAPMRAAANLRICVIIDDIHSIPSLHQGDVLLREIASFASRSRIPVIIGARRRFRLGIDIPRTHRIEPLELAPAATLIDDIARSLDVPVSDTVRDLLAVQMEGRLGFVRAIITAARDRGIGLDDYRSVQRIYTDQITSGAIGGYFDRAIADAFPDPAERGKLIEQLRSANPGSPFAIGALRERIGADPVDFSRAVRILESEEILELEGERAAVAESPLWSDYLRIRSASSVSVSVTLGEMIADSLKRAPRLMSREYRRTAAVGLSELLAAFDLQEVPRAMLDYRIFRDRVRGADEAEVLPALFADDDRVTLPQIVHAAPLAHYLPEFVDVTEPERAVAARGFASRSYSDENEIVWLAAEIDSKLEADETLAREWAERLERAAEQLNFRNFRIWLVAPEGFSPAALDHLSYRNAFGSSRRQAELLKQRLSAGPSSLDEGLKEFELVIPIGDDTELIAAHALEEISRRYDYPAKAINQMKTALVEACINAAEHGLSPDRKIYQKFAVGDRKVVITVSNRGLRLSDRRAAGDARQSDLGEGRRGWGLNLIRTLMDDVRVEPVEDGTRIVMTKLIPAA